MSINSSIKGKKSVFIGVLALLLTAIVLSSAFSSYLSWTNSARLDEFGRSQNPKVEASGVSSFVSKTSDEEEKDYLAEISYNNLLLRNGSIVRKIQIRVLESKLYDEDDIVAKEAVTGIIELAMNTLVQTFTQNGYTVNQYDGYLEIPLENYASYTDLYIAYGYDGYMSPEEDDGITEKGLFFNKYITSQKTLFDGYEKTIISNIIDGLTLIPGVGRENVSLVYNYGTKYSPNLVFSDADKIYAYNTEKIYIHKFQMDVNTSNRVITFTQTSPNVAVWYGFELAGAVLLCGIALGIYGIKERKKNK